MGCYHIRIVTIVVLCCSGGAQGVTPTESPATTVSTTHAFTQPGGASNTSTGNHSSSTAPPIDNITNNNQHQTSPTTDYYYEYYSDEPCQCAPQTTPSETPCTPCSETTCTPCSETQCTTCIGTLAIALPASFIAGMIVVFVPYCIRVNHLLCFKRARRGRWSGASDKTTEKVLRQLTLDRLTELERKQLNQSGPRYVVQADRVDIVITEPEEKPKVYEQLQNDGHDTVINSSEHAEQVYNEIEQSNDGAAAIREIENNDNNENPVLVSNEAEPEVIYTNADSGGNSVDENVLVSPLPLDMRARSGQQLYEVGRESAISSKQLEFLTIENENFRSSAQ